ncbi:MAG: tail fiber domain-containing protein [Bacteroidales bacterium]|nr:tail fiber domain-containing protein [Bacteroidales bacterium]
MKKIILVTTMLVILFACGLYAQNVAITDDSTYSAHSSAMLDVKSNTKGFLMPRTHPDSISNPAQGLMIFEPNSAKFYFYDGSAWIDLATISGGDSIWTQDGSNNYVFLTIDTNRVGIGIDTPLAKLDVMGDDFNNSSDTVPLFVVRDKDGREVFVVYPKGVFVYVDTLSTGTKSTTNEQPTGFRVGRKTDVGTKDFEHEYFTISPNPEADTMSSVARILWYPLKEAFMAGRVIVESPDSVGLNSWASGYESRALGNYSQALGYKSSARGHYSTAIGYESVADGDYSMAIGDSSWAGGGGGAKGIADNCYAFGKKSEALGDGSYAFGRNAISTGAGSFALGDSSNASNSNSYAFGHKAYASGESSYAFGAGALSDGYGSYAFGSIGVDTSGNPTGSYTHALGDYSLAFGLGSEAKEEGSVSIGGLNNASGKFSVAMGYAASALGQYNVSIGFVTETDSSASICIGNNSRAIGNQSTAIGSGAYATGDNSLAFTNALSTGLYTVAIGPSAWASGDAAMAMGSGTEAIGDYSTSMNFKTTASGNFSTAMGESTYAIGDNSLALGLYTFANGKFSITAGEWTYAPSAYESAFGSFNTNYTAASATTWNVNDRLFVIGNGTADINRKDVFSVWKNGNVGINTSTPDCPLSVHSANQSVLKLVTGSSGSSNGSILQIQSNRSGATILGSINFVDYTGTIMGQISYDKTVNFMTLYNNGAERMRISSNGFVSIGTTTPGAQLHVNSATGTSPFRVTINNSVKQFVSSSGGTSIGADITPPTDGLYVHGSVGIGTSSTTGSLHLKKSSGDVLMTIQSAANGYINYTNSSNTNIAQCGASAVNSYYYMFCGGYVYVKNGNLGINNNNPGQKLDITAGNGRVGSGYSWLTNSDKRYKKNITTLEGSLQKIIQLRGVRYDLIEDENIIDGRGKHIGFIAQELESQFPEFVVTGEDGFKSVSYDKMTAVLVEAVKEQQLEIQNQQQIIENQNIRITELEQQNQLLQQYERRFSSIEEELNMLKAERNVRVNNE